MLKEEYAFLRRVFSHAQADSYPGLSLDWLYESVVSKLRLAESGRLAKVQFDLLIPSAQNINRATFINILVRLALNCARTQEQGTTAQERVKFLIGELKERIPLRDLN